MQFTEADLVVVADILAEAARREIMPRFRNLSADDVRCKSSPLDLVTEADVAAERMIAAALRGTFPGAAIVGEEGCEAEPILADAVATAELAFIVDPIDGTRNFVAGLPLFGVMAAVTARGEVVGGVIHDPVVGDWAMALRGGGAWLRREDGAHRPLRVADPVPPARMEGMIATTFLPEPLKTRVNTNLSHLAAAASYRSAAHEYRLAASGQCHVLLYNRLMPWDHAAGWLLHREAGGHSAHFDGSPYRPAHRTGGLLYAPDEASWRAVRAALLD